VHPKVSVACRGKLLAVKGYGLITYDDIKEEREILVL